MILQTWGTRGSPFEGVCVSSRPRRAWVFAAWVVGRLETSTYACMISETQRIPKDAALDS